jgi:hypothetical protein
MVSYRQLNKFRNSEFNCFTSWGIIIVGVFEIIIFSLECILCYQWCEGAIGNTSSVVFDLRVSLLQIQESKSKICNMISGSPTPKKRQRKSNRKDVNTKNETVGQLNVDALLQLLERLMPIKMKSFCW